MQRTLEQWLEYQLRTHPQQIAMGLERVREVAIRMRLGRAGRFVITVAGTNGKGSTVAFIEAIARAASLRVGAFTSPHLLRYNERVRVCGDEAPDARVVVASVESGTVRLAAGVSADLTARIQAGNLINFVAQQVGGKGGGRPDFAQAGGTRPELLEGALSSVPAWVRDRI